MSFYPIHEWVLATCCRAYNPVMNYQPAQRWVLREGQSLNFPSTAPALVDFALFRPIFGADRHGRALNQFERRINCSMECKNKKGTTFFHLQYREPHHQFNQKHRLIQSRTHAALSLDSHISYGYQYRDSFYRAHKECEAQCLRQHNDMKVF